MNQYPPNGNPNYYQPTYYAQPQPIEQKASGVSIAALILGIVGFFINPMYLVNVAAIVLGIVGIATAKGRPKGMAITGLILGIVAMGVQFALDIFLTIITLGLGGISFFL